LGDGKDGEDGEGEGEEEEQKRRFLRPPLRW
jgi:hypothetical protein